MTWMWRRKNSWFSGETFLKRTPIPNPGEVLATSPFNRNLVSPNHNATSNLVSTRSGMGISTKQPPRPKSETLHHITGCPTGCNSAAMEHFTRGDWRRSLSAKRKLSITPDGKGKSQNGFSGVRLSSPIWPSFGDPGSPAHFTRKWTLFFPYVAPMISSTLTRVRTPPSFAPFLTDIDRGHTLGEYLTSGVSPKNADPHVDWFSRFTTLAHLLKYPRLRMIMEHRPLYPASHRNKPP